MKGMAEEEETGYPPRQAIQAAACYKMSTLSDDNLCLVATLDTLRSQNM